MDKAYYFCTISEMLLKLEMFCKYFLKCYKKTTIENAWLCFSQNIALSMTVNVRISLGIPRSLGIPTKYSMDTYSILQQVKFQRLRSEPYIFQNTAFF